MGVGVGTLAAGALVPGSLAACAPSAHRDDDLTPFEAVAGYNNYYEFGTDKSDPARNAHTLRPRPWTVSVEGEVATPAMYDFDDLVRPFPAAERV